MTWSLGADPYPYGGFACESGFVLIFSIIDTIVLFKAFLKHVGSMTIIKAVYLKSLRLLQMLNQRLEIFHCRLWYHGNIGSNTFMTKKTMFLQPSQKQTQHSWTEIDVLFLFSQWVQQVLARRVGNTVTSGSNVSMILISCLQSVPWQSYTVDRPVRG